MLKKATTMFLAMLLIVSAAFSLYAQDWEVYKEFDFNDNLDQLIVLNQSHGFLLTGSSIWEFTGHPATWTQKSDLPARMDPANPTEELSYTIYRMHAWGDTLIVVASKGTIFYSTDGATNWTDISDSAYIDASFEWIQGPSPNLFWIAGGTSSPRKGWIVKVENLSTTPVLTRQDNDEMDYKLSQIFFTDAQHGHAVAGGTKGDYFRTEDGGDSWVKTAGNFKGGTSGRIYDMAFASQNVGYAAAYYGYLYKTSDGGQTVWEQIETPENAVSSTTYLPSLYVMSEQELWVGGKEGRMYYSNDGGTSFTTHQIPSGNDFDSFWFCSANQGTAISSTQIFHALSGSVNWKSLTNWIGDDWYGLAVVGEDKLCMVTSDGMYSYGSVNELPQPTVAIPGNYQNLNSAYFAHGKGFLLGYKTLFMTTDDGVSWTEVVNADSGLSKYVRDMVFVDENTGYFGDSGGTLWKTVDGGFSWEPDSALGSAFYRLIFPDAQTRYILDYSALQLFKSTDGGETYTTHTITDISKGYLYDMELLEDGSLIVAGYDATETSASLAIILRSTDGGETWTPVLHDNLGNESQHLYAIEFNGAVGYALGNNGMIVKSDDYGQTWTAESHALSGQQIYLRDGKFLPNGDFYLVGTKGYVLKKATGTSVSSTKMSVPRIYKLNQNYPNPFNPVTEISYALPKKSHVTLTVYNAMGQEVATLVNNNQEAGIHIVNWEAKNTSSGVYFYKIQADGYTKTMKMLLLR